MAEGVVQIVIDYNTVTGEIGVVGPIENPTLFMGLLETAKMIMMEQRGKKKQPSIIPGLTRFDPSLIKPH